jgi:hypothetical protein
MRPVLNNINDSIFTSSMNLLNPFARPRPWYPIETQLISNL